MKITAQLVGGRQSIAKLDSFRSSAIAAVKRVIATAARAIQAGAQERAPVRSGALRRSIKVTIVDGGLGALIGTDLSYAAAQELGSGLYGPSRSRYLIRPKNAKALAWPAAGGRRGKGNMVFARFVWHPGVKPKPFLVPAFEVTRARIVYDMRVALEGLAAHSVVASAIQGAA